MLSYTISIFLWHRIVFNKFFNTSRTNKIGQPININVWADNKIIFNLLFIVHLSLFILLLLKFVLFYKTCGAVGFVGKGYEVVNIVYKLLDTGVGSCDCVNA